MLIYMDLNPVNAIKAISRGQRPEEMPYYTA
jgi:hypothetical protein